MSLAISLIATQSNSHTLPFLSLPFILFAKEGENVAYVTCHTGLIATQDYFSHRSILSQVYLPHGTIVCNVTT